jgi:hypothetical protein
MATFVSSVFLQRQPRLTVKVSRPRPSRLTDSNSCQADMNLGVIRTLVVDETQVLCRVLLAFHRAVVRRERER